MIRLCNRFDRYRDGELNPVQRAQFEAHLNNCDDCRQRTYLLNNLLHVLKIQPATPPEGLPGYVTHRVFQNSDSWDVVLASWLRPLSAWSAVAVVLVVSVLLWVLPAMQPMNTYTEYEALMMGTDPNAPGSAEPQTQTDEELVTWLELGGYIR
jgi:predicted anti-sigma-YlaC factor YlaD